MRKLDIVAVEGVGRSLYQSQTRPQLTIRDNGDAQVPQTHGKLVVWYEDNRMIVLKEQGHREYYNQYNPPFNIPTQFHVFVWVRVGEAVAEVGTFPVKKQEVT